VLIITGYEDIDSRVLELRPLPMIVRKPYSPIDLAKTARMLLQDQPGGGNR
jgi:hypothetical protein